MRLRYARAGDERLNINVGQLFYLGLDQSNRTTACSRAYVSTFTGMDLEQSCLQRNHRR